MKYVYAIVQWDGPHFFANLFGLEHEEDIRQEISAYTGSEAMAAQMWDNRPTILEQERGIQLGEGTFLMWAPSNESLDQLIDAVTCPGCEDCDCSQDDHCACRACRRAWTDYLWIFDS